MVSSRGKKKPDVQWYISQQLLPPITRLIEHIDGLNVDFVAQCLGADPKKYKSYYSSKADGADGNDANLQSAVLKTETQNSLADRSIARFSVICPYCSKKSEIPGIFRYTAGSDAAVSGLICSNEKCKKTLPQQFLKNRLTLFLRQLIDLYYDGKCK